MTSLRSPDLQHFLTSAEAAIRHGSSTDGRLRAAAERMFLALQATPAQVGQPAPARSAVCSHLPTALDNARRQPGYGGALADAFAEIEPQLSWKGRPGAEMHGEQFMNGHANAIIIGPPSTAGTGPKGLETRHDVLIGVSLMAPNTRYPDHHHPPEEIYVVLSNGEWRQSNDPWHQPGLGGLVYNPPNIVHAMQSAEQPLLALWFLWTAPTTAGS